MSLVLFTGVVGLVLAPGHVHIATALTRLLCIAVGAGRLGRAQHGYDADIDALMSRTRAVRCRRVI
jgi:protoheme IX farnesyltransferase